MMNGGPYCDSLKVAVACSDPDVLLANGHGRGAEEMDCDKRAQTENIEKEMNWNGSAADLGADPSCMSLLGHGASGSSSWQRTRDGSRPLEFKYISVFIIHIRLPSSCQACFHILSQPPFCPSDYTLHPLSLFFLPHRRRRQRRPPNPCLWPRPTTSRPKDPPATTSP